MGESLVCDDGEDVGDDGGDDGGNDGGNDGGDEVEMVKMAKRMVERTDGEVKGGD
jgi:hypothetical protein